MKIGLKIKFTWGAIFVTCMLFVLLISCTEQNITHFNSFKPKTIELKGVQVPKDSVIEPKSIPIGVPETRLAGKPEVVLTHLNSHIAGEPSRFILNTEELKKNTPGSDTFLLPTTVRAYEKVLPAGHPEVIFAKDADTKDNNPANFSYYKTLQGLKHNNIRCLRKDKLGNLWIGTRGGGVCRYDGKYFTNFTEKEGLSNDMVLCILEDKKGNLWFGTNGGGVSRFDGKTFTTFTEKQGLSNNYVWAIEEDRSGNLWFGTKEKGICRYDGKTFTNYTVAQGLSNNFITSIVEDTTGILWFGTYGGGVCNFDGKSFTNFTTNDGLNDNLVWSILEDKTGNLWFGTSNGVCRYDGNRVDALLKGENKSTNIPIDLHTINGKIVKTFIQYSVNEGLSHREVPTMVEDKAGNLWFGTYGGGICKFDGNRIDAILNGANIPLSRQFDLQKVNGKLVKTFVNYSENEGLSDDVIWSILEDKSGNLWIGTYNGGLNRYDGKTFTSFSEKDGLSNNFVTAIVEDKAKNLWFGSTRGLSCYNGKSFTNYTDQEGLSKNFIYSLLEDKLGNLWIGTNGGGVCRFNGKTFSYLTTKEGLPDNFVNTIFEDKYGNIWFGTNNGACRYDGNIVEAVDSGDTLLYKNHQNLQKQNGKLVKTFTNYTVKEGLPSILILDIHQDFKGKMWFATEGGGICSYDGKTFTHFTKKEGLTSNSVQCISEDKKGNLWFGTQEGCMLYDGKYLTTLTEKEGLINNTVQDILQDTDGNMWLGTRKGLSKISKQQLSKLNNNQTNYNSIKEALFYNYGYNDGFFGLNCKRNAVLQDSKGRIWWGSDVLTYYEPKEDIADTSSPNVNITSVKLYGEDIEWAKLNAVNYDSVGNEIVAGISRDTILSNGIMLKEIEFDGLSKWFNLPENLSLPYKNNHLTFSFIGVHMQSRNHLKYQYKLEGIDAEWSPVTYKTEATCSNLPNGSYVFKVRATNQSGVWSQPYEFKFNIRPPWWLTWWFRSIVGFVIILLAYSFFQWRTALLRKEKENLERTVEERTAVVIEQKLVIEEKHKEITDSINYAERIQRALLANKNLLDENLKDYFILFKPKDIVSGDFYWATKLSNNNFLLVTADSTGHGVPGAIMSILNIASLREASSKGFAKPEQLLNETRKLIIENLKYDGSEEGGKDGMDGSILSFDFDNNILECACAYNSVWLVRKNEDEVEAAVENSNYKLIEIKADRMPIGKHNNDTNSFTRHTVQLLKGDVIYALTDGFPDQFGGLNGKKFKTKQLQKLLLSINTESMEMQKNILNDVFDNWKGNLKQVDDVCIIGVRV
ncbi:MAG: SpoIIE family protein phosphatase [Bacteroidia bacterium]|nr:SpoIIE family protein phosphatase [Bacteroidia bacterium]